MLLSELSPSNVLKAISPALDELFTLARKYNSSDAYLELMRFVAMFRFYSPFNAMLIYTQMPESRYATLVHELAHLYCGHLGTPDDGWWPDRQNLSLTVCEFEAESVSDLVYGCWKNGTRATGSIRPP
jgi:hypothetical protein